MNTRDVLLALAMNIACAAAFAQPPNAPSAGAGTEAHEDWESIAATRGSEVRFRAMTTYMTESIAFMLISDRIPPDCRVEYLSINFTGPNGFDRDLLAGPLQGEARIDDYPMREVLFALSAKMGDEVGILTVLGWNRREGLHKELHDGKVIRFKLKFADSDYYLKFSLRGFGAATDRTRALCDAFREVPRGDGPSPADAKPRAPGSVAH